MIQRMARALRLDASLYHQVAGDHSLTSNSLLVIILGAVANAVGRSGEVAFVHIRHDIGHIIGESASGTGTQSLLVAIMVAAVLAVNGWLLWSFSIWGVGRVVGSSPNYGQLFRALGFAATPLIFVPVLGSVVAIIWHLTAGFTAIRQALHLTSVKALTVLIIGSIIFFIGIFSFFLGLATMGLGMIAVLVLALAPSLAAVLCLRLQP